jgi:hypothetical protein
MRKLILLAIIEDGQDVEIRRKLRETIENCKTIRWVLASQEAPKEDKCETYLTILDKV